MASAESFVSDLEGKNLKSFDRMIPHLLQVLEAGPWGIVECLKLELRYTLEAAQAAALWMGDSEDLGYKMSLASYCGACAQRHALLSDRLAALGVASSQFDVLAMGFSKLFGALRSMQTIEERAAAGAITLGTYSVRRMQTIAGLAESAGDLQSAQLLSTTLPATEQEMIHAGRVALLAAARNEESQARARRASFRVIELSGEMQDPGLIKRFLLRSSKKPNAAALDNEDS